MSKLIEGKYTVDTIYSSAQQNAGKKMGDSAILDSEADRQIPKFRMSELSLGRVLGRGYFCVVNEISRIRLAQQQPRTSRLNDERVIHNLVQDRSFMQAHCIRDKDCRYAIKQLQESRKKTAQDYIAGLTDLAVEARFLAVIRHPNIIKMRAVGAMGPFSQVEPFFLVLDRLYDTLTVRMGKWRKKNSGPMMMVAGQKKRNSLWAERMEVAYDLGAALVYLHKKRIVYRDLKPDNIGFDVRGDVKLFDFGLAKELHPHLRRSDGTYLLTEDTGSPRYMAPEVSLGQPYSEKVDVYSFSILLWEMLSLEPPFNHYSMAMLQKHVYRGGQRPKCNPKWSKIARELLQCGWQGAGQQRPSMETMIQNIRKDLGATTGVYYTGTDADQSSHSQHFRSSGVRKSGSPEVIKETARVSRSQPQARAVSSPTERMEF